MDFKMTTEQIKENAPECATHYRNILGITMYYKPTFHPELWHAWSISFKHWYPIFGRPLFIKPL